jgi:hypothetical protein
MSRRRGAVELLLSRIDDSFASGNAYEASQLYDTLSARLITAKHADPLSILAPGVERFMRTGQRAFAVAVSLLIPDTLAKIEIPADSGVVDRLIAIHKEFGGEPSVEFLRACVGYTSKYGDNVLGSAPLNKELGIALWMIKDYVGANEALAKGEAYAEHGNLLVEWSTAGYKSEVDLFVTRAVLQYLCLENMKGANTVYKAFMEAYENLDTPLTNFCKLCRQIF